MLVDLLATVMLSPGVKGFFEDPRWLLGLPLAALGVIGLMVAVSPELRRPVGSPQAVGEVVLPAGAEHHPGPGAYITVGMVLAFITIVEVGIYYLNMAEGLLVGSLLALSAMKFVLVVLWFMHLRFDNRLFSIFFSGAVVLVVALFTVVLISLGAGLV